MFTSTVSALFTLSLSMNTYAAAVPAAFSPGKTCNISKAVMPVPANQTHIVVPASGTPKFVGLAFGTQNYTCTDSTLTYASVGAIAELYDISCLVGKPAYNTIQDQANSAWNAGAVATSVADIKSSSAKIVAGIKDACNPVSLGEHFFITNPVTGSGLSPEWNFAASQKSADAFVVAARVDNLAAPTGTSDIDWLSLTAVSGQGSLASAVFRVDTRGGQPPSSCTAGSPPIELKYTAKYWLYK